MQVFGFEGPYIWILPANTVYPVHSAFTVQGVKDVQQD